MSYTPCALCGHPLYDGHNGPFCNNAACPGIKGKPMPADMLPRKFRDIHAPRGNRTTRGAFKGIA